MKMDLFEFYFVNVRSLLSISGDFSPYAAYDLQDQSVIAADEGRFRPRGVAMSKLVIPASRRGPPLSDPRSTGSKSPRPTDVLALRGTMKNPS
jgi:hypothetical protein